MCKLFVVADAVEDIAFEATTAVLVVLAAAAVDAAVGLYDCAVAKVARLGPWCVPCPHSIE